MLDFLQARVFAHAVIVQAWISTKIDNKTTNHTVVVLPDNCPYIRCLCRDTTGRSVKLTTSPNNHPGRGWRRTEGMTSPGEGRPRRRRSRLAAPCRAGRAARLSRGLRAGPGRAANWRASWGSGGRRGGWARGTRRLRARRPRPTSGTIRRWGSCCCYGWSNITPNTPNQNHCVFWLEITWNLALNETYRWRFCHIRRWVKFKGGRCAKDVISAIISLPHYHPGKSCISYI